MEETILEAIFGLYRSPAAHKRESESARLKALNFGSAALTAIADKANVKPALIPPRRRVTVMIIGNHSAGKSSWINYYVEQDVLASGVAVETKGFCVVRSGKSPQDVKGEGALVDNDHLAAVASRLGSDRKAFIENLTLLVRPSTAKDFPNIDFIDTPGLLDGEIRYPFDVNKAILEMASVADLILVFLDPVGQALCSRTMAVVKQLNDSGYYDKMRYYLTKADTVSKPEDLNKVIVQVTQNLSLRVANTHGFDIQTIWIPQPDGTDGAKAAARPSNQVNSLTRVVTDIHKTIQHKVQDNMNRCQEDCRMLIAHVDRELEQEERRRLAKRTWFQYQLALGFVFVALAVVALLDILITVEPKLPASLTAAPMVVSLFHHTKPPMLSLVDILSSLGLIACPKRLLLVAVVLLVLSTFMQFFKCRTRNLRTRSKDEITSLRHHQTNVEVMLRYVQCHYEEYVRAAQTPEYKLPQAAEGAAAAPAELRQRKL